MKKVATLKSKRLSIQRSFKHLKNVPKYSTIDNKSRICGVCGAKLTNLILDDPDFNYKGYYIAIRDYDLYKKGTVIIPICSNVKLCKKVDK